MDLCPLFLSEETVLDYHDEQMHLFGGTVGPVEHGLLSSAIASPQNIYLYEEQANLFDLAAAYAFHIAKNHAFTDGNKRTALQATLAFLRLNGYSTETSEKSLFDAMCSLASGAISEEAFSNYLRNCSVRLGGLTAFIRGVFGRWQFFTGS